MPFEPTAFPSDGCTYLMYELYLTNFQTTPLELRRIDVLDADTTAAQPTATFDSRQLNTMLQPVGAKTLADLNGEHQIAAGGTVVVFISVALSDDARVPDRLVHRVATADSAVEGAIIGTRHTKLHVLAPPVDGANWLASDGPGNEQDNHHRRGVLIINGRAVISRRYAIDWKQIEKGAAFSGNSRDPRSYYAYGKPVYAVAEGHVVTSRDGLPDNAPGHNESFHPATPITIETVAGNNIVLDLGGGQFAYYMQLQPQSLRVKAGNRVCRGQMLARIGNSGDAREPHLHFEVTTSSKLLAGEGVPYVIDQYRSTTANDGTRGPRKGELPLNNSVVAFGEDHVK